MRLVGKSYLTVAVSKCGLVRARYREDLAGFFSCAIVHSYFIESTITSMKERLKSNAWS